MKNKFHRVIFDTNVWISFLIGKKLAKIKNYIINGDITLIVTEQLIQEIRLVTGREKLKKYFSKESVDELLELIEIISENIEIQNKHFVCRDPKDNFLLDLVDFSKADFLVTGDKDLLEHNPFLTAKIVSPVEFEEYFKS